LKQIQLLLQQSFLKISNLFPILLMLLRRLFILKSSW